MIEEIKIDGKVYELFHDSSSTIICDKCDLLGFVKKKKDLLTYVRTLMTTVIIKEDNYVS